MNTRHKHADKIIDWAENGGEWQVKFHNCAAWDDCTDDGPMWNPQREYRRKPKAPRVLYGNLNECDAHSVYGNDNRMETGVKFIEVTPEIQALLDKENERTD